MSPAQLAPGASVTHAPLVSDSVPVVSLAPENVVVAALPSTETFTLPENLPR